MPDAPLSRRARRTFEEEAADRAALQDSTSTPAQGLTSGEMRAMENERAAALSRRDRRRMERLNHPLEAWTAEEEMLATGQIPVMTPERIAEQERISREKAARAAEEAEAASQEFRRLAEADVRRAPEPAFEESVVEAPVSPWLPLQTPFAQPPVAQAPVVQAPAAPVPVAPVPVAQPPAVQAPDFPAPVAQPSAPAPAPEPQWAQEPPIAFPGDFQFASTPTWPEQAEVPVATTPGSGFPEPVFPEPVFPEQVFPERVPEVPDAPDAADTRAPEAPEAVAHGNRPVVEAYQPVMALDDAPLVPVVHPVHEVAPVEADSGSADEPVRQRADILDALFPPGSSQTALRQLDPFANGFTEETASAASGQVPTLLPPQEVPERETNPIDEIRRLTAEAMGGIERASKADEAAAAAAAAVAATAATTPDPSVSAEFDSLPWASARQNPAPHDNAVNRVDANPPVDSIGDWAQTAQSAPTASSGGVPLHTGFDQLTQPYSGSAYGAAPASGQFPTQGQYGAAPASGQFPTQGQYGAAPASGQFPMPGQQGLAGPQGPAWNSQPLHTEPGRTAEAQAFTPLSNVPKPDFSGLYQQGSPSAFPPLTGAINTAALNAAEFHGGDMSASGQTPGFRRPDLPEVGGVKHFKWLHLSVIGALMFVLGVVIYNVAFNK